MWDRVVFKDRAKAIMKDHYWKVFLVCLIATLFGITTGNGGGIKLELNTDSGLQLDLNLGIFKQEFPLNSLAVTFGVMLAIMILVALILGIVLDIFVFNVLRVGFCRYLVLTQQNGCPADIDDIFWGFGCGHYLNIVKTMFFRDLYQFLWTLVFIIPGIIKTYEYTCVPYILAEHPEMDYQEVLALSTQMTDGYKIEIFILALSFLGWELVGALLFGIGTLFVTPYVELTHGEMYAFLRDRIFPAQAPDDTGCSDREPTQDYSQDYTY